MSKFKQKSPIADAIVWDGENEKAVQAFMPKGSPPPLFTKEGAVDFWTPCGIVRAREGFFIVKEADGSIGVMRPESFVGAFECIQETDKVGRELYAVAEKAREEILKQRKEDGHGEE